MVGVNGYFFLSHFHHRECGRALRSLRGKLHARFNIHVIWKPIPRHSEHGLRVRLSVSLLWFHRHFKALAFLHTIQGSFYAGDYIAVAVQVLQRTRLPVVIYHLAVFVLDLVDQADYCSVFYLHGLLPLSRIESVPFKATASAADRRPNPSGP